MTEPSRPSLVAASPPTESKLRHAGRELLVHLYAALRSLQLYPVENAQVQKALDELHRHALQVLEAEGDLEFRVQGEFIFINSTRLRLELESYASFSYVLNMFRVCDVGKLRVESGVERREWQVLLSTLLLFADRPDEVDVLAAITERLMAAEVYHLLLELPLETEEEHAEEERRKEAAKRTYMQSVAVMKEVTASVRMGRTASVKKVKRAVQAVVDQVLSNEASLLGLTTIRDYDEYTFTHCVNVCIFSVALGRKIGLTKLQLYELGMAALMHDVGKSRIPIEVMNKPGALNEEEWALLQAHPWMGVLTLFELRGYSDVPYRSMIVAHEHHMKTDLTGYPKSIRERELSVFSKIVAVADGFDAATTRRVYQTVPIQPDEVLREMWENPRRGYDPIVVKAFINLIGVYPVGTCVILDTYEVALVHSANPDVSQINRPVVRILLDERGVPLDPGPLVNLGDRNADGSFPRSIIKVTDPARYGITVGDHFV